jgi:DNA-binding transcriptional LysR family regulator
VNTGPPRDANLDIRSLRYFVTVAEELHFTRAAERLFIAQQALSREIRELERRLGTPLFVRTTRRVTLTPEGERLLARARDLVALHDEVVVEMRQPARPVLVDLMSEGRLTAVRILQAAREAAPDLEFRRRYGGGMGAAIRQLQAAELDIAFGRAAWRGQQASVGLARQFVRYEPLAALLPLDHPLAGEDAVRVSSLRGVEMDVNPGHPEATEWTDLMSQFVALTGGSATPPHLPAVGLDDQAHHLVQQGLPIITTVDHVAVPGGVVRPIVDPVAIYPWAMLWRTGAHAAGVAAIQRSAREISSAEGWLELPADAWLPEPEASSAG